MVYILGSIVWYATVKFMVNNAWHGARSSANVFIVVDMEKAMRDGIEFYNSSNGVILTEGLDGVLDPKYFKDIIYKNKYNQ